MSRVAWSAEEEALLAELYPTTLTADIADIISARFGTSRTATAVRSRAKILRLHKAPGYAGNPPTLWTDERAEWFRAFVPGHTEGEIADAFERRFGFRISRSQLKNAKTRFAVRSGTTGGRFEKGQESWNKGKTWDEFMPKEAQEKCRATQFKKGDMPHNGIDKPIGTERVDRDGYIWVKVAERPSRQDCNDNWKPKHRLVWEEHNGPIPDDHMVVFLDGDRTNFDISNLAVESKLEHAIISRHHIPFHDSESHSIARAVANLKHAKHAARGAIRA